MVAPIVARLAQAARANAAKASKSIKNPIETTKKRIEHNKESRPRTLADDRYNARRRAKRAEKKLERLAQQQTGKARKATLQKIADLQKKINESYFNFESKLYPSTIESINEAASVAQQEVYILQEQQRSLTADEIRRINKMQMDYFKKGSLTEEQKEAGEERTPEQKLIRAEVDFFYKATRVFWDGGSTAMRNENILNALKDAKLENGKRVETLKDAFDFVKERYGDEFPSMDKVLKGKYDTDKDKEFSGEQEFEDDSPLPITWSMLTSIM